ncbi:MAG: NAD(P)-dependent oxidoreductase [Lachnospiraceae bacterium]|nr:NAD(P)-dependent oxidoreductase [Lachnospiraceae bacterium]
MSVHVLEEANRCLQCKNPRCMQGCPIHTKIPEMIRMLKEGETLEAANMLYENNPLSMICSLVCNHEVQCEGNCVRGIKENPVHISAIENYISDSCFERLTEKMEKPNGMKVAVIGAGPAGITIAMLLAEKGYKITVFETRDKIGGIMRYGIPEFRLPKSVLDRYFEKMKRLGILFRPNFGVGGSVSIQDLLNDGYQSVFIGTGAWRPRRLNIPGETFGNVQYAINYLNNPDVYDLGDRVAVIGSGNAAMDAARTAIRHGSRMVTVFSRDSKVSASKEEYGYAQIDGVKFVMNRTPVRITDEGPVLCESIRNEEGKMEIKEGSEELFPADSVIIAVSQIPQDKLVNRDKDLKLNDRGNLATNEKGETTMPGVFASGDVVTGAKTVVHAVRYSKEIAEDMDRYMKSHSLSPQ